MCAKRKLSRVELLICDRCANSTAQRVCPSLGRLNSLGRISVVTYIKVGAVKPDTMVISARIVQIVRFNHESVPISLTAEMCRG